MACGSVGVALQVAVLVPVWSGEASGPYELLYRLIGGSFVAAGLIGRQLRPANRVGPLMVAVGFAFFVGPLLTQLDVPAAFTLGQALADAWVVVLVGLLLSFPDGRLGGGDTTAC